MPFLHIVMQSLKIHIEAIDNVLRKFVFDSWQNLIFDSITKWKIDRTGGNKVVIPFCFYFKNDVD